MCFDFGSGFSKIGFCGDDAPRGVIPTIVGRLKKKPISPIFQLKDAYIGEEAISKIAILNLNKPIRDGRIDNFEDFEKLLNHSFFNELGVAPEEHPLLLAQQPMCSKSDREKCAEILFESFQTPALYMQNQIGLSFHSSGKTTGFAFESGYDLNYCLPIVDGVPISHAMLSSKLAGKSIDSVLTARLIENEYWKKFNAGMFTDGGIMISQVSDIIKTRLHIDLESSDHHSKKEEVFTDHYNNVIHLDSNVLNTPELYFRPHDFEGIHDCAPIQNQIFDSIAMIDLDYRQSMWENIVIAGGATMMSGFTKRLEHELTLQCPTRYKPAINAPDYVRTPSLLIHSVHMQHGSAVQ